MSLPLEATLWKLFWLTYLFSFTGTWVFGANHSSQIFTPKKGTIHVAKATVRDIYLFELLSVLPIFKELSLYHFTGYIDMLQPEVFSGQQFVFVFNIVNALQIYGVTY